MLHRPDWAQARAEHAYCTIKQEYGWDRIAQRTAEICERIAR